jgi:hypothetical protein
MLPSSDRVPGSPGTKTQVHTVSTIGYSQYQACLSDQPEFHSQPNTATRGKFDDARQNYGDFARLIPANNAARKAFHVIVGKMMEDPTWEVHARQFVHVDEKSYPLVETEDSDSDIQYSNASPSPIMLHQGHYRLNLNLAPQNVKLGWVIGKGRRQIIVDLKIADNDGTHVHGAHGLLRYHRGSVLVVESTGHLITVDGKHKLVQSFLPITEKQTGLAFGQLSFILEYTEYASTNAFQQHLSIFLKDYCVELDGVPASMLSTPAETDSHFGDYVINSTIASGSTCIVSKGVKKSDATRVAIKKMWGYGSIKNVRNEVEMLKLVKGHVGSTISSSICLLAN